jgi:tuftelin-interacting protein 11
LDLKGVKQGFESGIELMSEAMNLEDSERMKLARPSVAAKGPSQAKPSKNDLAAVQVPTTRQPIEVTFKSVVEEYAANHNLLFMPLGKMHEKSRQPLYRVTARSDGRGGIVVYLADDMIWEVVASKGANVEMGDANLISTEEMVLLASKAR